MESSIIVIDLEDEDDDEDECQEIVSIKSESMKSELQSVVKTDLQDLIKSELSRIGNALVKHDRQIDLHQNDGDCEETQSRIMNEIQSAIKTDLQEIESAVVKCEDHTEQSGSHLPSYDEDTKDSPSNDEPQDTKDFKDIKGTFPLFPKPKMYTREHITEIERLGLSNMEQELDKVFHLMDIKTEDEQFTYHTEEAEMKMFQGKNKSYLEQLGSGDISDSDDNGVVILDDSDEDPGVSLEDQSSFDVADPGALSPFFDEEETHESSEEDSESSEEVMALTEVTRSSKVMGPIKVKTEEESNNDNEVEDDTSQASINDELELQWMCKVCGESFDFFNNLQVHQLKHDNPTTFYCSFCCKQYKKKWRLAKHLKVHQKKTHVCAYCGKKFRTYWEIKKHIDEKECLCDTCEKSFPTSRLLMLHKEKQHSLHSCVVCRESFRRSSELMIHKNTCWGSRVMEEKPKASSNRRISRSNSVPHPKTSLKRRFPSSPSNTRSDFSKKRDYFCVICENSFKYAFELSAHRKVCMDFHIECKCSRCGQTFGSPELLASHKPVHFPYTCVTCNTSFQRAFELCLHRETCWNNLI